MAPTATCGPFGAPGQWYRGNLHGHTTESDGALSPAAYAAAYRERGHDFLAVTDHWRLTDMGGFAGAAFAVIPGAELDGPEPAPKGHHVVALGIRSLPPRVAGAGVQDTVNAIAAAGGLAFIAHPHETGLTSADLLACQGFHGLEVWNTCSVVNWGKGNGSVQWDELLQSGRTAFGLATDDCHRNPRQGDDLGFGWVVVRAERLTAQAILAALAMGRFYASTGPEIADVSLEPGVDGATVATVRCSQCQRVHFLCDRGLGRSVNLPAAGTEITEASRTLPARATYLRIECVNAAGRSAWTNPVALGGPSPSA